MNKHQLSPHEYNAKDIVQEYNVDERQVKLFLKYFKPFSLEDDPAPSKEREELNLTLSERWENVKKFEKKMKEQGAEMEKETEPDRKNVFQSFTGFKNIGK